MAEKYLIRADGDDATFEIDREGAGVRIRREGAESWQTADLEQVGDTGLYVLMVDNRPTELYIERRRGGAVVTIGRHTFDCDVGPWRPLASRAARESAGTGPVRVHAPMTGSIVEVRCSPGEAVQAGQVLLVIESMKMNNELRSTASGTIETVAVSAGQRVKQGDLLVAISRAAAEG